MYDFPLPTIASEARTNQRRESTPTFSISFKFVFLKILSANFTICFNCKCTGETQLDDVRCGFRPAGGHTNQIFEEISEIDAVGAMGCHHDADGETGVDGDEVACLPIRDYEGAVVSALGAASLMD